jgi:PhnB protein
MPSIPYLHFQGQCAQALAFYVQVFNGTGLQAMRYADAPDAWQASGLIMHGQVTIYDGTLMVSDYPPQVAGDPQTGFSVMQTAPDALSVGGTIIDAFRQTFFSPGFGMVKDRFGTPWIISAQSA